MSVIDSHCHYGLFEDLEITASTEFYRQLNKKYDCKFLPCISTTKNFEELKRKNLELANVVKTNADLFTGMCVWVSLREIEKSKQLVNKLPSNLVKMLKIIAHRDGVNVYSKQTIQIAKFAAEKNLPLFVHCGKGDIQQTWDLCKLAKECPEAVFIMGHTMDKSWNLFRKVISECKNFNNLYHDTSGTFYGYASITIKALGSDKFLFGSDVPILIFASQYEAINSIDISAKDKRKIFYENARKLLKL